MIVITGTNKRCIRISITAELVAGVFMERFCNAGLFPLALPCLRNSRTDWELAQLSLRVSEELRVWQSQAKPLEPRGSRARCWSSRRAPAVAAAAGRKSSPLWWEPLLIDSLVLGEALVETKGSPQFLGYVRASCATHRALHTGTGVCSSTPRSVLGVSPVQISRERQLK